MSTSLARPARSDALLVPQVPGEAYAADLAELGDRQPGGPVDAWLLLAHTIARAASLPTPQRMPLLVAGADRLGAVLPANASTATRETWASVAGALRVLAAALDVEPLTRRTRAEVEGDTPGVAGAIALLSAVVAHQEQAELFRLAFSTLSALRAACAPLLDRRSEGLLLAQQGRAARQAGALHTAGDLYRAAVRLARVARAPELTARALLGAGALASVRGNYPEARALFGRALRAADQAQNAELLRAGHHGLLVAAFAARDVDTALTHGWAAVCGLTADAGEQQAEMLVNLGEIGRLAGEDRAALGACLRALELTDVARVRLPALGTAARAAARLGEYATLRFIAREAERAAARSAQPFEQARVLVELAEAYELVDPAYAIGYAARAAAAAERGGFHELVLRAESVHTAARDAAGRSAVTRHPPGRAERGEDGGVRRPVRSARARAVVRSLERLPAGASGWARGLTTGSTA